MKREKMSCGIVYIQIFYNRYYWPTGLNKDGAEEGDDMLSRFNQFCKPAYLRYFIVLDI